MSILRRRTRQRCRGLLVACAAGLLPGLSNAAPPAANVATQQARTTFVAAEQALQRDQGRRFRHLLGTLENYPLYPYLRYADLNHHLSAVSANEVADFLTAYADTPLASRLRDQWLAQLATAGDWSTYLAFYRPTENVGRRCQYRHALLATGYRDAAFTDIEDLWLSGKSQPEECDPLFSAWREAGKMSMQLVWQRIALAMEARQIRLARYLKRFLNTREQHWAELWIKVHREPNRVTQLSRFSQPHPWRSAILAHGLRRLARKDLDRAVTAWDRISQRYPLTADDAARVRREIALAMARDDHPDSLRWLAEFIATDASVRQKHVLIAMRRGDWAQLLAALDTLPAREQQEARWRYWRARALEQIEPQDDAARHLYTGLSMRNDYYGLLAADQLGIEYAFQSRTLDATPAQLDQLRQQAAVQRVTELLFLGRVIEARQEWQYLTRYMSTRELLVAAALANSWQWHDRVIITLGKTPHRDHLEARFPLAFRQELEAQAARRGLDSSWVFAMARQESAFMPDARSSAGALGLLQLMPGTARQVARGLKTPVRSDTELVQVNTNLRLGTSYLRSLLDRFDNRRILATASYNAGPHRVVRWLPEQGCEPGDVWVEGIPYKETRNYVKRVLSYAAIYAHRLGRKPQPLKAYLKPVSAEDSEADSC